MITKTYFYKTEQEKMIILLALNSKYGHLYEEGLANIYLNEKQHVIITNILKERI